MQDFLINIKEWGEFCSNFQKRINTTFRFSTFYLTLNFGISNFKQFWTQICPTIVFPVRMELHAHPRVLMYTSTLVLMWHTRKQRLQPTHSDSHAPTLARTRTLTQLHLNTLALEHTYTHTSASTFASTHACSAHILKITHMPSQSHMHLRTHKLVLACTHRGICARKVFSLLYALCL